MWIKLQELQDLREEEVEEMEEEIAERAPSPISNAGNNLDLSMDDLSAAFTEPPKPSPADSIPLTLLSPLEVGPRPLAATLRDASAVTNRRFSPTKMPSKRTPKRARANRSKLVVDSKFSVAVAGVLEALEQVAGVNPAPPGSSLFSRVESVAEINMALFNHLLSRQRMPVAVESSGDMQSSSLPIRSLRSSLEAMGLVPQIAECSSPHALTGGARRRMELLLAQFRVKHVSLFGMAFTVVLCALERLSPPSLPNSPSPRGGSPSPVPISSEWLPDLLQKIEAILSKYLSSLRSQMESEDAVNPLDADPTLDQYEFDDVVRILEREKKPLLALFAAYTPWVSSSSAVRGLNTPQKDLPSAAAASQCGRRAGWRISQSQYCERFLGAGPAGNLMRWHDALTFAKEFAICPSMLSFSQFNEIFHSVAAGEAVTNTAPSLLALSFVQV